jgi:uncharacterized protein
MPLTRERHIQALFAKRLKSNAVVVLNGARQVGKSFLSREILKQHIKNSHYLTLDNRANLEMATTNPSSFLRQHPPSELLIIDEAQKAPMIFDAVKEIVDLDRSPQQFLLLGSTEFSHRTKVKESLTGRATYLQLFPFNLAETKHLPLSKTLLQPNSRISRSDTLKYLERGGMPGIFAVRDNETRMGFVSDWIQLTVERDLQSISGRSAINPLNARRILEHIATQEDTSDSAIAKSTRMSTKSTQTYLHLLKALFVVSEVPTCLESTGRSQFVLCDTGIANAFGAPLRSRLKTWVHLEILSNFCNRAELFSSQLETYRGPKGGRIDFILKDKSNQRTAILILPEEKFIQQDLEILKSFASRFPEVKAIALAPVLTKIKIGPIDVLPWEAIC